MYNYNQHLHFIGIGGVGMAGIAEILLNLGYPISGSDLKPSSLTEHLQALGAQLSYGHRAENIPPNTSVVVLSSAVGPQNEELLAAAERQIPLIPRAEMLAELMRMKYGIAIAGSHGKTSTTSMTAKVLRDCGFDPTVIIGGRVLTQQTGASLGTGQYLVAEADESDGSFSFLKPAISIVTNIDAEHLSHYGSFGALEEAFFNFMSSVPFYGLVVACGDEPVVQRLLKKLKRRVLTFGLAPHNDICATEIEIHEGGSNYVLHINSQAVARVSLPLIGAHMVSNSLACIGVGLELGATTEEIISSLSDFPGVARRSELIYRSDEVVVIDDYGHHPREITSTINAVRQAWRNENGRLRVLFQPHRYSRTRELFSEFLTCFSDCDELFVLPIYPAGEEEIPGVNAEALTAAMQHPRVRYCSNSEEAVSALLSDVRHNDVILTMGAGSVTNLSRELARELGWSG